MSRIRFYLNTDGASNFPCARVPYLMNTLPPRATPYRVRSHETQRTHKPRPPRATLYRVRSHETQRTQKPPPTRVTGHAIPSPLPQSTANAGTPTPTRHRPRGTESAPTKHIEHNNPDPPRVTRRATPYRVRSLETLRTHEPRPRASQATLYRVRWHETH